ncbi:hypothetical protein [Pseudoalteromonas aurantia]|uniref:Uncharacterized protein n=1 Tax=Pseudoalteromonas aurantia TaxID=43654 RepID=A0A5S3V2B4_9GAMM|nr:hypothetical protein [Pseudoalteromonas aurantia]TMO64872.1 hypothetical protein CWC19_18135 [Pseudoalteromonas aurantia]
MNISLATVLKKDLIKTDPSVELFAYSGRCMYGKRTIALSGNFSVSCIWKLIIKNRNEIEGFIKLEDIDIKHDKFGLGTIVY